MTASLSGNDLEEQLRGQTIYLIGKLASLCQKTSERVCRALVNSFPTTHWSMSLEASVILISFPTQSGRPYQLQTRVDLKEGQFSITSQPKS